MNETWAPGADAEALRGRALLLRTIREFFHRRSVMEVTTPVLGAHGVSDVHIDNIAFAEGGRLRYLQTSPEYFLKRLLASGVGAVYQLGPVFRGGESGRRHNVEFTMLEWYRPGFTLSDLIDEVCELLGETFAAFGHGAIAPRHHRYKNLFRQCWGANPHELDVGQLQVLARDLPHEHIPENADANDYLDLLFSQGVEPGLTALNIVEDYPATQAALAEVGEDDDGDRVAFRFECIWNGIELANGYRELRDGQELSTRMATNNAQRRARGLPEVEPDDKLIAALPHMPPCSGVALGVDRLLMLLLGRQDLDEVMAFSDARL